MWRWRWTWSLTDKLVIISRGRATLRDPFFIYPPTTFQSVFSCGRPTLLCQRSLLLASGVRFKPEDALTWRERTHPSTVRTFHMGKTPEKCRDPMFADQGYSIPAICSALGISRTTLYRSVKEAESPTEFQNVQIYKRCRTYIAHCILSSKKHL